MVPRDIISSSYGWLLLSKYSVRQHRYFTLTPALTSANISATLIPSTLFPATGVRVLMQGLKGTTYIFTAAAAAAAVRWLWACFL